MMNGGATVMWGEKLMVFGGQQGKLGTNETEEMAVSGGEWTRINITLPCNLFFHYAVVVDLPR